jgi:3,4-dihydroxy 2-butanone 4-phosphate synthase
VNTISNIKKALADIRHGKFVLIHDADDREGESDFIMAAEFVTPNHIKQMRKEGGGLLFLMISDEIARMFKLPFMADIYSYSESKYPILQSLVADDIPYDEKSSFSIWINHRDTFTGITDKDRSLTMKEFALLSKQCLPNKSNAINELGKTFRSPGHVPICRASKKPLVTRFGHTELATALLTMAKITPVACGCEIMGDKGGALSKKEVKRYADKHDFTFLEGKEIVKSWNSWSP